MSYSLNSFKGGYIGDYVGVIKGDTRSLDSSSYGHVSKRDVQDTPKSAAVLPATSRLQSTTPKRTRNLDILHAHFRVAPRFRV